MTLKFTRYIQAGWNAGVALDFSNGVSVGVTGGGNYGKGRSESEAVRHLHSRIGSAGSRTALTSGGDTTLQGARVLGQGIALDARNLHIESLQDSARHNSSQYHGQGQVTVGYGFSADGSYQQSQLNAEHQSVAEQSGLYAGDDGFQVSVNGHTRLNGGLIVSGEAAESAGRNRFVSGSLSSSDLANHSRYSGRSFGIGAGLEVSGQSLGQGSNKPSGLSTVAEQDSVSSSLGYGRDSDSQSSVTRSGIGTRNIHITDAAAQQAHTGHSPEQAAAAVYTELRLGSADAQAGYLNNRFNAERVQNEIDLQRTVSQDFSQTRAQVIGSIDRRLDRLKEQRDNGRLSESDYQTQSRQWQQGKVLLNMLAAGLASPADNAGGIAAATASPALSYQIGQYFKANDLKNQADGGQRPGESSPAHLLAHSILGAAVAAAGGHNALSGALSAGGAEAAAPVLSRWLYGKATAELTAEEKQTVAGISGLLGAGIGAAAGNSSADAVSGGLSARNAVEDNGLTRFRGQYYMDQIKVLSQRNDPASQAELAKLKQAMAAEHLNYSRVLESTCKAGSASACRQMLSQMGEAFSYYQAEALKNHNQPEVARLYRTLAQQSVQDMAMMQGYLNGSRPTNRIGTYRTTTTPADFRSADGKNWNDGRYSAGFGHVTEPHYMEFSASFGPLTVDHIQPNTPYLKPYIGTSLSINPQDYLPPFRPGASAVMGWIDGHHHNNNHFVGTNKFLRGLTGSIQGCAQGICIGRDHPLVENDHGIGSTELGIGTRGGTVSIGYTFDPYDNQSVSDKFERGNQ